MSEHQTVAAGTDEHIRGLLAQMTLEEKAALTVGRDSWTTEPIERLGIPSVWVSDGPTGLRKSRGGTDLGVGTSVPATCFPTESALAASWDAELVSEVAQAIATEAQAEGVQVVLGPGVNLKRSPLCGRNFEYFSEDPILTGRLASAFVSGLQERGVGASVKHLVANESETDRMITDSLVDERTLRELYLRPFEIAVSSADPWTLMAAYNRLNGSYCTENTHLLREIVEGEWSYRGIVMSDWFAINDRAAAVEEGLHLQMPASPSAGAVVAAVREGRLSEARLDEVVGAMLAFVFKADAARRPDTRADLDAHHRLARRAAADCVVLLKNEGGLLPLKAEELAQVALVGVFAREPRYQGAGSSQVVPARPVESIHDELDRLLGGSGQVDYAPGYGKDGAADPSLEREAQEVARKADVAVVVVGLPGSYEEEGADRTHIDLPPGHDALVDAVLEVQPRTVVVLLNGSAVAMPWVARVPALVEGWLGGQGGGGAIAEVLVGRVNPSGKLAETFPVRLEDTPAYLSFPHDGIERAPFGEGLFTGYRWYEARRIEPLFPFGHGLSYTSFEYSDLAVESSSAGEDRSPAVSVSLRVRNTGERPGQETVQVYVAEQRPALPRPLKELKAFAKVSLAPGQETEVRFSMGERDFAVFDPRISGWTVTSPGFDIFVGASSDDIRLQQSVTLELPPRRPAPPLTRLSALRDWLARPAAHSRLERPLSELRRELLGAQAEPSAPDADAGALAISFLGDMPIAKLVMLGLLTEDELAQLTETANKEE